MNYYNEDYDVFEDYDFNEGQKKKGKWKWIAIIVAVVLAIAAVVGVLAVVFRNKDTEKEEDTSFIQEGLVMYEEPELRLSTPQGIRFLATVSPELKKEVESDENKCIGFVIAPLSFFHLLQ